MKRNNGAKYWTKIVNTPTAFCHIPCGQNVKILQSPFGVIPDVGISIAALYEGPNNQTNAREAAIFVFVSFILCQTGCTMAK